MADLPNRVCIIGAGSSGIAACKVLHESGIAFDCYEAGDKVGGNWVYNNSNGMSSAYTSLFINTSKPRMAYSDYPMPEAYPVFPHHSQIAAYFDAYVEHFGVKKCIRFNTRVMAVEPVAGGGWDVTLDTGEMQRYRAVLVANGHHWQPRWPDPPFPGQFDGTILHSHAYKTPDPFTDTRVLVVGFGNSAMDIATETSRVAAQTYIAVRRGFHVIPKYILGRPLDAIIPLRFVPITWQNRIVGAMVRLQQGKLTDHGLPAPDHPFLHAHPTVSSDILGRIAHGRVIPKPNIARLDGDGVIFADGTRETIDTIIYCTGYNVSFPFLRPAVVAVRDNDLPLFRRVFHPDYPDLFFIGLLQPIGAIMPLAELQSRWVSAYLLGNYALPPKGALLRDIVAERAALRRRYGNAPRHTMQVDFHPYIWAVQKEMAQGAHRTGPTRLIRPEARQTVAVS